MTDLLGEAIAEERAAFEEDLASTRLDDQLFLLVLKENAIAGYGSAAVPFLPLPIEFAGALSRDMHLDLEFLAGALARSIEILRPRGRNSLLGAALAVRETSLRLRTDEEERLELVLEAIDCFAGPRLARLRGRSLIELGTILRDGRSPYDALLAYRQAELLLMHSQDSAGLAALSYHRAVTARVSELYEEGLQHLDAARHHLGERDDRLLQGLRAESTICLYETGDVEAAAITVDEWIAGLPPDTDDPFNSALPYSLRARIRLHRDELDPALDDLTTAAQLAGTAIRQYTTRTFRATERAQLQPLFDQAVQVTLSSQRPDLTLGVLRSEKSATPGRLHPTTELDPDETAAAEDELRSATSALARTATGATVLRDLNEMARLSERAGELVDHADLLAGRRMTTSAGDTVRAAARLRESLRPGELMVEYVTVSGQIWAISVRQDAVRQHLVRMTEPEAVLLAAGVRAEREALQPPRALNQVGGALLEPLRDLVAEADRLYVVLPPSLPELPLHAVDVGGAPLVISVEVAYLPSVEFLDPGSRRPASAAGARVVAVPEPRYEVLPPLDAAVREATAVAARLDNADIMHDDQATAAAFLDALEGPGLLHVASHAAFEQQAPLLARLLMADRPVFAFEIALARVGVGTVNLSGCGTASQLTAPGGEGDGLGAAFLAAGVSAVVASWWPVRDDVAAAFNEEFYERLHSEPEPDPWSAANAAQRTVRNRPGWEHPAVWAPFVVLGTPVRSRT